MYTFISNKNYDLVNLQSYLNQKFTNSNIEITGIIYDSKDYELTINISSNLDSYGYSLLENSIVNYSLSNTTISKIIYEPELITTGKILEDSICYKTVKTWIYPGSDYRNLGKIDLSCYLKENYINEYMNSNYSYSVRLMDVTNNLILGEGIYKNHIELDNSFLITNLNKNKAFLELQLQKKCELGNYIELNSIIFNYII
jgi:hypothetical protein